MINDKNIHAVWNPHKSLQFPARAKAAIAAERSLPRMHWQWCRRTREIDALLGLRRVSALPDNDAGLQAAQMLARHFMRLKINAEQVTRANFRLLAPWLTREETVDIIQAAASRRNPPSAAEFGRAFNVTAEEVAALDLKSFRAVSITREEDRNRQGRRRRKLGGTGRRGRPPLELSAAERKAHTNAQAAARMRALRLKRHDSSPIISTSRDEFSVTLPEPILGSASVSRRAPKRDGAAYLINDIEDGTIQLDYGVGLVPPPGPASRPVPA